LKTLATQRHAIPAIILFSILFFSIFPSISSRAQFEMIDPYKPGELIDIGPQKELRGGTLDLKKYRGKKIVVLAFWINSCDLCMGQMKLMDKFIAKNGRDKNAAFISVARAGAIEKGITFDALHESGLSMPVILDPTLHLARKFGVTEIPTFILIDKNGRLACAQMHYADTPIRNITLFNMIDLLREGKKIPDLQFMPYTENAKLRGMIGKPTPDFQIGSIDGKLFSLGDYNKKMNVALIFWHPYSPECTSVMKVLNNFYTAENRSKYNFVILAVSSIYGQSQMDEERKYQKDLEPDFPLLDDVDNKAGHNFNVTNVPTIFIIDKNGRIADAVTNELMDARLSKRLAAVLETLK